MRILLAMPLLAAAACQVTTDDQNDSVTVEYNQDVAENGLEEAANLAENVAATVANDIEQAADKVENTDIQVDVEANANKADASAN